MKIALRVIVIITLVCNNSVFAQNMTVKDSDSNVLMEVDDKGTVGALSVSAVSTDSTQLSSLGAAPGKTSNKLYNVGSTLYWNGSALGSGSSAIDDLSDGKTAGNSVFLGSGAGVSNIGDDNHNTAIGFEALNANTTGRNNTATGFYALRNNTTGNYNTACGIYALNNNTTGSSNTVSGYQALFLNTTGFANTANGAWALYSNTTGNYNVGIGYFANYYNEGGDNNTIIGYEAGGSMLLAHDKSGNVFIGYQAGYNETGSDKLYIENSNNPSPLIGGDFKTDELYLNGSVGIGTTSLSHTLEVNGRAQVDQLLNDKILNVNRAGIQSVTSSGTISVGASYIPVEGSGVAASNVTIATTVGTGLWDAPGRILIIEGINDINTVTIVEGTNVNLASSTRMLGNGDILMLIWNGYKWLEVSYSDN